MIIKRKKEEEIYVPRVNIVSHTSRRDELWHPEEGIFTCKVLIVEALNYRLGSGRRGRRRR